MSADQELKLYQTHSHTCSYLPEQQAQTLFVDPEAELNRTTLTYLSQIGFRRSGDFIYRPNCSDCEACIPARVPVAKFQPNRKQRRVCRRNQNLEMVITEPRLDSEIYNLFERYITARHSEGDMFPTSEDQFVSFLVESHSDSRFLEFRDNGELVAVAVTDVLDNALSAIYTFFDPNKSQNSYGVYSLLSQIEYAHTLSLDYLYLGYWIKDCQKMRYKTEYRPVELFVNDRWALMT